MNANTEILELSIESKQTDEALLSIFHTILFHRSVGKFSYNDDEKYEIGTIGYTDVECDFIDLTYVCLTSTELDQNVRREIGYFGELLRVNDAIGPNAGQISLEFFKKSPNRWLFQQDYIPWEVWTIRLDLLPTTAEQGQAMYREKVGELITEKILYITDVINRYENYTPKIPQKSELGTVFDTSYRDIQPYLFKFSYSVSGSSVPGISVGSSVKKLLRDTLSF
ncbi:hypothetical protein WA026_000426 [Henosepilachna vigintioctopunctata]|uniref:Autophagy-related protein 101 n=1 Tax=Henosepilachna vigintioctopunctata TaxID=420089 RepID=A0AAW1V605_9CUCU